MTADRRDLPDLVIGGGDDDLDARRDGWGRRLVAAAEQVARERGCTQVVVSSSTFQAPGFYERCGFVETGRIEGLPLDGVADVQLRKRLVG